MSSYIVPLSPKKNLLDFLNNQKNLVSLYLRVSAIQRKLLRNSYGILEFHMRLVLLGVL